MLEDETAGLGRYFEVDLDAVLRERFSSGKGAIQLLPDMTDEMLLLTIKHAVSFSDGQAFVVVPPSKSQGSNADDRN